MEWRCIIDFSSFFLFEATGDSEAASDPLGDSKASSGDVDVMENDDAESCSCDVHEVSYFEDKDFDDLRIGGDDIGYYGSGGEGGLDFALAEEVEMEVESGGGGVDGSRRMMMDEMENKLFWEACLEVGYP
ncbi:uncharacterized protein LOC131151191 [Malania oleifera]|uniref:uncharacterized protein LOC131151191 n=1 Tax=Malania oleifera TaxID=397392 RepID=UPI0025AE5479|nr:uncharacterized protein LOC131151191 [Malania oleifera]